MSIITETPMKWIVFSLIWNNPHLDNYMNFVEFPKVYIGVMSNK